MSKSKKIGASLILSYIVTFSAIVFGVTQCIQNNRITKHGPPELDVSYIFEADTDDLFINIINVGFVDCEKVWLEEKIYVLIGDLIYEGVDIPHFNYIIYNDSRDKLFELDKADNNKIKLDSLGSLAIHHIIERFEAKVVSCWKLSYKSDFSEKQFSVEKYFIHNNLNALPSDLFSMTGGLGLKEKIERYRSHGEIRKIKIFELTDRFELNTPDNYLITNDSEIRSLDNQSYLTIEELMNAYLILGGGDIQNSEDMKGTLKWIWEYNRDKNEWIKSLQNIGKSKWYGMPFKSMLGYLRMEDYKKVINDIDKYPSLTSGQISIGKVKINEDKILIKAKEKFIKDTKNR